MILCSPDPPPIVDRVRAEQANAWVTKWRGWTPHCLFMVISGKSLTVHAMPGSTLLYRLLWTGDGVLLFEVGVSHDPYRFRDVQNALIFLDALLMQDVARLSSAAAAVGAAPRHAQDKRSG